MLKAITDLIGSHLDGSHGFSGRAQGAAMALALGLGCLNALRIGYEIDMFFWRQFIRPGKNLKQYGSWAAVTGATDGIGRAYCDELAKQGLNILLISRTESKLKAAAEEIGTTFGVETKFIVMDLVAAGNGSCEGPEWASFKPMISSLDIGVFINNAGQASGFVRMHEMTSTEVDSLVAINCASMVKATHAVLPGMVARGKGAIVNISSVAGTAAVLPTLSVYAATKSFVDHFSKSLAEEYGSLGIDIQAQAPALVATKMSPMPQSWKVPPPGKYVAAAVKHIGYENHAVPYYGHALCRWQWQLPQPLLMLRMRKAIFAARDHTIAQREAASKEK